MGWMRETISGKARHWRSALIGGALASAVTLTPQPAVAFLDTQKAWNDLLQFAVRQINAPGEFEIELGEVTRPDDGFAQIASLRISDGDGVWLDAKNLLVDWNATSLLRGRFFFEELAAEEITVLRAPISRGDPPEDSGELEIAWPRPPVAMNIEEMRIDRLRIQGGLLPQDIEARVTGSFRDEGDIQQAALDVARTDRKNDNISVRSVINFDAVNIDLALKANEAPGGLVAGLANVPKSEALNLDLNAKGDPSKLPFALTAEIGEIGIAKGNGLAAWQPSLIAKFDGSIKPGPKSTPAWKRALGKSADIKVDVSETERGAYQVGALQIDSEAFQLNGGGSVDVGANTIDIALDWDATDVDAFNAIVAPMQVSDLSGRVRAKGTLTAPNLNVDARIRDLSGAFGSARGMSLAVVSAPGEDDGGKQRFAMEAKAEDLALKDRGLQTALGSNPTLIGTGAFLPMEGKVQLDTLALDAATIDLAGAGSFDIEGKYLDASLSGEARALLPLIEPLGLPVDGIARLALKLEGATTETVDRLFLNAQLTDLDSEDKTIAAALGETAELELLLKGDSTKRVTIERGYIQSEILKTSLAGSFSIPADKIEVDLDWSLLSAEKLAPLIVPAKLGAAKGDAKLSGSFREPNLAFRADADDIAYDGNRAKSAIVNGSILLRKDRRAPFSLDAKLNGFRSKDDDLKDAIGAAPQISATGLYDTATGLFSLDSGAVELERASLDIGGDISLRKKTLDISYKLDAEELSGFSGLAGTQMAGAANISGRLNGPFDLPLVTAKGKAKNLRYGDYQLESINLNVETNAARSGLAPFNLKVDAANPLTGNPALDALLGSNPYLDARGRIDPRARAIRFDHLDARLETLKANAKGGINLSRREADIEFDIDASDLSGLSALLGEDVSGTLNARGRAIGSFDTPELNIIAKGNNLRYAQYSARELAADIGIEQSQSGYAPFSIDLSAFDATTGDPKIDALLAGNSTLSARGDFSQTDRIIRLKNATAEAAGAKADASGNVFLDPLGFDLRYNIDSTDLQSFSSLIGSDIGGAVSASGTLKGTPQSPALTTSLSAAGLQFAGYGVQNATGSIDMQPSPNGGPTPFNVDMSLDGITGSPEITAALGGGSATLKAGGLFDPVGQRLSLNNAQLGTDYAAIGVTGDIDLANKQVNVSYNVDAYSLAPFGAIADIPLTGQLSARGTANGPFQYPRIETDLAGSNIGYKNYSVGSIGGFVRAGPAYSLGADAPFELELTAGKIATGDPAIDAVIGKSVSLSGAGTFNAERKTLALSGANFSSDFASASVNGFVDASSRQLDIDYALDAKELAPLSGLAGETLAGSIAAKGSVSGSFDAPAVKADLSGQRLAYGPYSVEALDGVVSAAQSADGFAPYSIDAKARGIKTGEAAIDALLSDAKINAKGGFDQTAQRLRLESAFADLGFVSATASGDVDIKARSLDIDYALTAKELAPLSGLAGESLAGSVLAKGSVSGSFDAPAVNADLSGQRLAYGPYSVEALDGVVSAAQSADGFAPFSIDAKARGIKTGEAAIDALLSDAKINAKGGFDQTAQRLRLDSAFADLGFANASLSGDVDIKARQLDIDYALDAKELAPLSGLAGETLAGSIAAKGSVSGSFDAPAVNADLSGQRLAYGPYSVETLDGIVSTAQVVDGFAPFSIDAYARGIKTGEAEIDALLSDATINAKGGFDQTAQRLRVDSAFADLGFVSATASGDVDIKARSLDIDYALDAKELAPLSGLAGESLAGSIAAKGSVSGSFDAPAVNADLSGQRLAYGPYSVEALDGIVSAAQSADGFAPFSIDATARGTKTGETEIDALLSDAKINAKGGFDQTAQRLRLESAFADLGFVSATASGNVDIKARSLDIDYALTAKELAPLSGLAGESLAGSVAAKGSVSGSFDAPAVNADLSGQRLAYGPYSVEALDGVVSAAQVADGFAPFSIYANARGIKTGEAEIDAMLSDAKINAKGGFDQTAQRLRLDSAFADLGFANASASGDVDIKARRLDIDYALTAKELAQLSGLAGETLAGSIAAMGSVSGSFDAPALNADLSGQRLAYGPYSVEALDGIVSAAQSADGFAPFSIDATARGTKTGETEIDALLSDAKINAKGGFDQTAQRLRLESAFADLGFVSATASGNVDIKARSLDIDYALTAKELAPLSGLAGESLAGSVAAKGSVSGSFDAPAVNADLSGQRLAYGPYSVEALDGIVSAAQSADGFAPFSIDATARGTKTGETEIDALLSDAKINAKGGFDQTAQRLRLESAFADLGFVSATASGNVDIKARSLDIDYALTAKELAPLSGLAGESLAGSIAAKGSVSGSFDAPAVNADLSGQRLAYGPYSVEALDGTVSAAQSEDGFAPFSIDANARGIKTGEAEIDALLSDATINAKGGFDQTAQRLRVDSAFADLGFANASASGDVDIKARQLDIDYALDAKELAPLSGLAGETLAGSIAAKGSVSGSFDAPAVNADLSGQRLAYGPYSVETLDGIVSTAQVVDGFAPFSIDAYARGIKTGEAEIDALLSDATINAKGGFDQTAQRLRVDSAFADLGFVSATASGDVDIKARSLDIDYALDAKELAPLSGLAGESLAGSIAAKGSVSGSFDAPAVNADLSGQRLAYGPYSVEALDGIVSAAQSADGFAPFSIDATARGTKTGETEIDALLSDAKINAKGGFDQTAQRLRLESAFADLGFVSATASGNVDIKARSLDIDYALTAKELAPLSGLAGESLAGSVAAKGSVSGSFDAPAVNADLSGQRLAYGPYSVEALDGVVSAAQVADGFAPFSIYANARGIKTGEAEIDAMLSDAKINAKGGFDQTAQRLRLDSAFADLGFANASASGDVDIKARRLDIDYALTAKELAQLSGLAGETLAGSIAAMGSVSGSFDAPALNADLSGQRLAYGPYSVEALDGIVSAAQSADGFAPFSIDANARGIKTGESKIDALLSDATINAKGGFDQTAQRLRLDSAFADLGFANASASGNVDIKARSLDIDYALTAKELAPLSGLAGETLAGSIAAKGSVSGSFDAPAVNADLSGQRLAYGPYSVEALDGTVSAAQSEDGFAPFSIDANARGIKTGEAEIDALLSDATINAKGGFDQTAQRLRVDSAFADLGFANASASGDVDIKARRLNIDYALDAKELAPLSGLAGETIAGSIAAKGSASGSFIYPAIRSELQGQSLQYDDYSLAALDTSLTVTPFNETNIAFALEASGQNPDLADPSINDVIGGYFAFNTEGTFDLDHQKINLSQATVKGLFGNASAFGDIDLKNENLDLAYQASLLDLSPLHPFVGQEIAGNAEMSGRLYGAFSDPSANGSLSGGGLRYDQYAFDRVALTYDIQNLMSGPVGSTSLDGETAFGPVAASARFSMAAGRPEVEDFSLNGLGLTMSGGMSSFKDGTFAGQASFDAFDLSSLGGFLSEEISGNASGSVTLSREPDRQSALFDLDGTELRYAIKGAEQARFARFTAKGQADNLFGDVPIVDALITASDGAAMGFPIDEITANAKGPLDAVETELVGNGGITGSERINAAARLNLVSPPRSAYITRFGAAYQGIPLALVRPILIEEIPPGGVRVTDIDARLDDGELRGSAEYTSAGLVADLSMRNIPLALAGLAGVDVIKSGRLEGDFNIDTRGGVRGSFDLSTYSLRLAGAQIDEPFDFTASGSMDGQALSLEAMMDGATLDVPLTATARIPLLAVAGSPLPLPDFNAPFSGAVDWSGDIADVWIYAPLPDHILSGPVTINGRASGTLTNPSLTGGLELNQGRYSNLEFGTQLNDINATGSFRQDGSVVFDLTANDGLKGSVTGSGFYRLADGTLNADIGIDNAALAQRDDITAVISGRGNARSEGNDILVSGAFNTDYVEFRLVGGFGPSLVDLEITPVGATAPLTRNAASSEGSGQRILLDLTLDFPGEVFVRGRGLDSEWEGGLKVTGMASDPELNGLIERRRGQLDLLGRYFELAVGEVRFTGPLDPYINVKLEREANGIKGWLAVEGPSSDPSVGFGSTPDLPEGEVLPRLLFGRSQQSLTAIEAAQLASGVATLLSGKAGVIDNLKGALGIDVLRVEAEEDGSTSIVTGKYLRENIFVGAKRNLADSDTTGLVEVEVFDDFELEGEFSADETRGSVNWKYDY